MGASLTWYLEVFKLVIGVATGWFLSRFVERRLDRAWQRARRYLLRRTGLKKHQDVKTKVGERFSIDRIPLNWVVLDSDHHLAYQPGMIETRYTPRKDPLPVEFMVQQELVAKEENDRRAAEIG